MKYLASEYFGRYIEEFSGQKWVVVPKEKVSFLHYNSLSSDIMMGIFEEDNVIYLMSYVFEKDETHLKCHLLNIKRSNYKNIREVELDRKTTNLGHLYYAMDSIFYNEWCTRDR